MIPNTCRPFIRIALQDADPETKMAMKKSFQTSGGTVLSTNWKEVATKNYEVPEFTCTLIFYCVQCTVLFLIIYWEINCNVGTNPVNHNMPHVVQEERQAPKGMEWRSWEGQKLKQVED